MSITGKRFIITGAAGGIGSAITAAYVKEGAQVVAVHHRADDSLPAIEDMETGRLHYLPCDIVVKSDVDAMVAEAVTLMGGLDGLVHAAAIAPTAAVADITVDAFDTVMAVNVRGTMLTNQAVFPHLKEKGGRIINFASSAGVTGMAIKAHYAASKGAVLAWTRSLASAWGPFGITVNAVCPVIRTPMYEATRRAMTAEQLQAHDASLAASIPLGGQFGDAVRDCAPVVVFLGGEGARFVTGQTYAVDGGVLMVR